MARPARGTGEAAEQSEIKHFRSSRSAPASQALRLIITPNAVWRAHQDLRAALEAERIGLIDPATRARLCQRARCRIRRTERQL